MLKFGKAKEILVLQATSVVYTLATVAAKFASGYEFLSAPFICCYLIELAILAVYAVLWQQIIKKFDISVAYANRAVSIFWALIWAVLFFKETITWNNVLGVVIVFVGILVVNSDES